MKGNIAILILVILVALVGCDKDGGKWVKETEVMPEFSTTPISVTAGLVSDTKGMDPLGIKEIQNFGMYAIWKYDSSPVNRWLLTDQMVQKEVVDESTQTYNWIINPQAYWPLAGNVSFFFYTPFRDAQHPEINFIPSTSGMPGISFTPGDDIVNQYDFCVAEPLFDRTSAQGSLPVNFDHVLSAIYMYANYDGILPPDTFVMIDSIRFENIYGTKTIWFKNDGTKYGWEDETALSANATYLMSRKIGTINTVYLQERNPANDNHVTIYGSQGRLYLLPQTLSPSARLMVYYGFYMGGDPQTSTLVGTFDKEVPFPENSAWPMGKTIKLKLTLGVGLSSATTLDAQITDWTDSNNKVNNGNPIEYQ